MVEEGPRAARADRPLNTSPCQRTTPGRVSAGGRSVLSGTIRLSRSLAPVAEWLNVRQGCEAPIRRGGSLWQMELLTGLYRAHLAAELIRTPALLAMTLAR